MWSFVLSACLSVCEQNNSRTWKQMSTKHGRHGQGLTLYNFWWWSNPRYGFPITFPFLSPLHHCGIGDSTQAGMGAYWPQVAPPTMQGPWRSLNSLSTDLLVYLYNQNSIVNREDHRCTNINESFLHDARLYHCTLSNTLHQNIFIRGNVCKKDKLSDAGRGIYPLLYQTTTVLNCSTNKGSKKLTWAYIQ